MKRIITFIFVLIASTWVMGQTPVGTGETYTTLKAAFDAINAGTLTGDVVLELTSSTSETASALLNASGTGSANYTSVTIYPDASGYSISGSMAGALIQLDGADNVTIDGRAGQSGSSKDLTISNTNTTGQSLVLINDATNNTIQYCDIQGVNSSPSSGVIVFSTSTGTSGNSDNLIDYCDIHDGATTPANLIYSIGSSGAVNQNNTVSNSNLYNWFLASTTSHTAAIWLGHSGVTGYNSAWTINANSFYQTASRSFSGSGRIVSFLSVNNTASGVNFQITNNYFGGSASQCGGSAMTFTGSPIYRLLYITHAVGTTSTIADNTFQNISLTTGSGSTALSIISHLNGNIIIDGNTIGSMTTTDNITMTNSTTSTAPHFYAILCGNGLTPSTIEASYNNIGGITVSTSSTGSTQLRLLYSQAVAGSSINFHHNTVGGSVANSIQQTTNNQLYGVLLLTPSTGAIVSDNVVRNLTRNNTGVTGAVAGITVAASGGIGGNHVISDNEIFNLTSNSTNVAINNIASVVGLSMTANGNGGTKVRKNEIYNLINTDATVAGWINGMYFSTPVAPQPQTVISENNIYGLNLSSTTAGMAGILFANTGNALIYNNLIRLGWDASWNDITTPLQINGIYEVSSGNVGMYYNSIYLGGSGVTGSATTYVFAEGGGSTADTVMNNIFYNTRSNGTGTGYHLGIYAASLSGLVCNYNDVYVDGSGGAFGYAVSTSYPDLGSWQSGTGFDTYSISADPLFTSTSNLSPQNGSPVIGLAYTLSQVKKDYAGNNRGATTTLGAYEIISATIPSTLTWTGNLDNNWHNPYNWNGTSTVPGTTTDVTIPNSVTNFPTLARNGYCNTLYMESDASLLGDELLTLTNSSGLTVERTIGCDNYHSYSPSVSGATANIFHLGGATGLDVYLYSHDEVNNGNSSSGYFEIVPTSTALTPMAGYAVYPDGANATPPQTSWTFIQNGGVNTGSFGSSGNVTRTGAGSFAGFNYLGNPYTSFIDWDAASGWTKTNVNSTIWVENAGNWASYTPPGPGVNGGTNILAPGQGFFLEVNSSFTSGTVAMDNDVRTHTSTSYLKDAVSNFIKLAATGNGKSDETVIRFDQNASSLFDGDYDGAKLAAATPDYPQIYSLTDRALAYNAMPESKQVQLGFHAGIRGEYTISALEIMDIPNVWLEDTFLGIFTDLTRDSYIFHYTTGENNGRFILHFSPLALDENNVNSFLIYAEDREIIISMPALSNGTIQVFNLMGQELASTPIHQAKTKISMMQTGYYLVKVVSNERVVTKKVFVR